MSDTPTRSPRTRRTGLLDWIRNDARTLVTTQTWGVLSTLSKAYAGHPFGSIVPYDIDSEGRITILIARIAEHFKNLTADSRAGLLVTDAHEEGDPQKHARATVLLRVHPLEDEAPKHSYYTRFPSSKDYDKTHDFQFFRSDVLQVRWIGGFGQIGWIKGEDFRRAEVDPLAYVSRAILDHMNEDHLDALRDLVVAAHDVFPLALRMSAIDENGFTIKNGYGESKKEYRFTFSRPVKSLEEARGAIIELLRAARGDSRGDVKE